MPVTDGLSVSTKGGIHTKGVNQVYTGPQQEDAYIPGISPALYRAFDPAEDYYTTDQTTKVLKHAAKNLILGRQYEGGYDVNKTTINPTKGGSNEAIEARKVLEDAWRFYLGLPQKHGSIMPSLYKPSKAQDKNAKYYKLPDSYNPFMYSSPEAILSDYVGPDKIVPPIDYALGTFKYDAGQDALGKYVSYYDKWDLNPVLGKSPIPDVKVGKPFEVYDRMYYDPQTLEPSDPMDPAKVHGLINALRTLRK